MTEPSRAALPAALVALPALLFPLVWGAFLSVKGPWWLGSNLDPDYAYLLNGLNLASGFSPGHVDHPGTTVQLLVAGVIRLAHAAAGPGLLADDVLGRPEHYLLAASWTLLGLLALCLAWAGLATWRATGSVAATLAVQVVPALSSRALSQLVYVRPEPLLLVLTSALAALVLGQLAAGREPGAGRGALLGAVVGLAACTKITAAPLVLLPLILLRRPAARLAAVGAAAAAFAASLAPAAPRLGVFGGFLLRIATHSGHYGSGAPGLFDTGTYAAGLGRVASWSPELVAVLAGGAAVLALARRRPELRSDPWVRALAGSLAAQLATVLVVARHPAPHYALPAIGLGGLSLALSIAVGRRAIRRPRLALALAVPVAAFLAGREAVMGAAHYRTFDRDRSEHLAAAAAAQAVPGATVVYYYRASAPAFALRFGDEYSAGRWTASLGAKYAGTVFYNPFTRSFASYGTEGIPPPSPDRPLLFQGSTLGSEPFTEPLEHHGLVPVFRGPFESVYRAPAGW